MIQQIIDRLNMQKYSELFWKSGLSIADQFAFSAGNFLLNIFLVRFISPQEYGAFAIAFVFFLFISYFYNAFFFEPLSVIGHSQYGSNIKEYLGAVINMQIVVSIFLSFLFTLIFGVTYLLGVLDNVIILPLLGASLAFPFILFIWLLRRICYLEGDAHVALSGSVLYTVTLLTALYIAKYLNLVSPFSAFMLMLFASVAASILLRRILSLKIAIGGIFECRALVMSIVNDHFRYGKWLLIAAVTTWLRSDFYVILIGIFLGISQVGVYGALENLLSPLLQGIAGLSLLLIPWFVRNKATKDLSYVRRNMKRMIFANILISIIYSLFIVINGKFLMHILYRKSYFDAFMWLLPYLGVIAVLTAVQQSLSIVARVLQRSNAIFWARFISSAFVLTVGMILVYRWKFHGAMIGISTGILLECAVMLRYIRSYKE